MSGAQTTRREGLSAEEAKIWADAPLLVAPSVFRGRLLSESWSDGFVALVFDDPSFVRQALVALQDWAPTKATGLGLPPEGVLVDGPREGFLGRVIVEFSEGGAPPTLAADGEDPGTLGSMTLSRLRQLAAD